LRLSDKEESRAEPPVGVALQERRRDQIGPVGKINDAVLPEGGAGIAAARRKCGEDRGGVVTAPIARRTGNAHIGDARIAGQGLGAADRRQREAKVEALSRAGYLLLPSLWYENAPVAIVEAAAYGLGVIGSDIGAIPEFVEEDRTGLLFPTGDAAALAALMTRVAQDAAALPGLEARSEAFARRFAVDRMIDAYE
jgi:glycosyltransferase involved in cell wall biosynthesis